MYAYQRLHIAGVSENIQAQLENDRHEAMQLLANVVSQGRAEVAAWRTYSESQVGVAMHEVRECQELRAELSTQQRVLDEHIQQTNADRLLFQSRWHDESSEYLAELGRLRDDIARVNTQHYKT